MTCPATASCDGDQLTTQAATTCVEGGCDYVQTTTDCAAGGKVCKYGACTLICVVNAECPSSEMCVEGFCKNLCAGVECSSPPPSECDTEGKLVTYGSGTCKTQTGTCDYAPTAASCPGSQECVDGACGGCGDGIWLGDEPCDDGNLIGGDGCDPFCEIEVCGDGNWAGGNEECDDNNAKDGEGCSGVCGIEPGWVCNNAPNINTGTDPKASGGTLAIGAEDLVWSYSEEPDGLSLPAVVAGNCAPGFWIEAPSNAQWINRCTSTQCR